VVYGIKEGSYGYWDSSSTGPGNRHGTNWNPEFYNSTYRLAPGFGSDNPKGVIIPAITNTTACTVGWYAG